MLVQKVIPDAAKGEKAKFDGYIELTAPTFDQRYRYIEACGFETDEKNEIVVNMKQLGAIRKMVSQSEQHYKTVKLTKKKNGQEYKSFNDLAVDPDCDPILLEVAGIVMRGFTPSKN